MSILITCFFVKKQCGAKNTILTRQGRIMIFYWYNIYHPPMGNFLTQPPQSLFTQPPPQSTPKTYDNFYHIINDIATNYILTMDFQSMKSLSNKEYCDKLVVLTADIIDRYFNDMQVSYLEQKIKDGAEVNDMTTQNVIYLNRDNLNELDIQNDRMKSIKKKRVCIGIAKYYIKIAHIFAAIVMTINPIYVYRDAEGHRVKKSLFEKDTIPEGVKRNIYKINICDNRIKALMHSTLVDDKPDVVDLHPKICSMNLTDDGMVKSLADEPGIAELEQLYLDDEYDYSTGVFKGMSPAAKQQYARDLYMFYKEFTGNTTMPPDIKRFGDIKLIDYSRMRGCQGTDAPFKGMRVNKKDKLFMAYADNIRRMISEASSQQNKLLNVINMLFTYVNDPYTGSRKIRINPTLTDNTLQQAVEITRRIIVKLYVKCEFDYVQSIKIYQAIVENQILESTQRQIANLENRASEIIRPYKPTPQSSTPLAAAAPMPPPQIQQEPPMPQAPPIPQEAAMPPPMPPQPIALPMPPPPMPQEAAMHPPIAPPMPQEPPMPQPPMPQPPMPQPPMPQEYRIPQFAQTRGPRPIKQNIVLQAATPSEPNQQPNQ